MTLPFCLLKSYVKRLSFDIVNPNPIVSVAPSQIETRQHVNVTIQDKEDIGLCLVDIGIVIDATISGGDPLYKCELDYAAVVMRQDAAIEETELTTILKSDLPLMLFDDIRFILLNVTRDAGYSLVITEDIFYNTDQDGEEALPPAIIDESDTREMPTKQAPISRILPATPVEDFFTLEGQELEKINYDWIIEDMKTLDEAQSFFDTYTNAVGDGALSSFQSLPAYKSYFRFFTPIDYRHPIFEECDESVWPMLFQMLYGVFSVKCQIVDVGDEVPDIKFSYGNFSDTLVSSLSFDDLKMLLSDLMVDVFVNVSVDLVDMIEDIEDSVEGICLMSKEDYRRLFNLKLTKEASHTFDMMYERIKECNIQTLLYR